MAKNTPDDLIDNNDNDWDFDEDVGGVPDFMSETDDDDDGDSRNPKNKFKSSIIKSASHVGKEASKGAALGIAHGIERAMPEVRTAYDTATDAMSELNRLKYDVLDKSRPVINETKKITKQLLRQTKGLVPFGLDQKLLAFLEKHSDSEDKRDIDKAEERQNNLTEMLENVFKLQTEKAIESQQNETVNRVMDEKLTQSRHSESMSVMSAMKNAIFYQTAFTKSVFTSYLKKDLELKLRHFYVAQDTLGILTNTSKMLEQRLDAITHNTSLPDAVKVTTTETAKRMMRERFLGGIGTKTRDLFSRMGKRVMDEYVEPFLGGLDMVNSTIEPLAEFIQTQNEADEYGMSFNSGPKWNSKTGLAGLGSNWLTGVLGSKFMKGAISKLPPNLRNQLSAYMSHGKDGVLLLLDKLSKGDNGFSEVLRSLIPDMNDEDSISNFTYLKPNEAGTVTNRTIETIEKIIPGYLSMQTKFLEILATGNSNAEEKRWDFKNQRFASTSELTNDFITETFGDEEKRKSWISSSITRSKKLIDIHSDYLKREKLNIAYDKIVNDVEKFKMSLALSGKFVTVDDSFVDDLKSISETEGKIDSSDSDIWKYGLAKCSNPKAVASFLYSFFTMKDGKYNRAAMSEFTHDLIGIAINVNKNFKESIVKHGFDLDESGLLNQFGKRDEYSGSLRLDTSKFGDYVFSGINTGNLNNDANIKRKNADEWGNLVVDDRKMGEIILDKVWSKITDPNLRRSIFNLAESAADKTTELAHDSGAWAYGKIGKIFGKDKKRSDKEFNRYFNDAMNFLSSAKDHISSGYDKTKQTLSDAYVSGKKGLLKFAFENIFQKDRTVLPLGKLLFYSKKSDKRYGELRDLSEIDGSMLAEFLKNSKSAISALDWIRDHSGNAFVKALVENSKILQELLLMSDKIETTNAKTGKTVEVSAFDKVMKAKVADRVDVYNNLLAEQRARQAASTLAADLNLDKIQAISNINNVVTNTASVGSKPAHTVFDEQLSVLKLSEEHLKYIKEHIQDKTVNRSDSDDTTKDDKQNKNLINRKRNAKIRSADGNIFLKDGSKLEKLGGVTDGLTSILNGKGIAGEAGKETILPHKANERFKKLIFNAVAMTFGKDAAERILKGLDPNQTTVKSLGLNVTKFADGGTVTTEDKIVKSSKEVTVKSTSKEIAFAQLEVLRDIRDHGGVFSLGSDVVNKLKEGNAWLRDRYKSLKYNTSFSSTVDKVMGHVKNVLLSPFDVASALLSNKVCDVYRLPKNADDELGVPLVTEQDFKDGLYADADLKKRIKSVDDIRGSIWNYKGELVIQERDIQEGLCDEDRKPISSWARKIGRFARKGFGFVPKVYKFPFVASWQTVKNFVWNDVCDVYLDPGDEKLPLGRPLVTRSDFEAGLYSDEELEHKITSVTDITGNVWDRTWALRIRAEEVPRLVDEKRRPIKTMFGRLGRILRHGVGSIGRMVSKIKPLKFAKFAWNVATFPLRFVNRLNKRNVDVYSRRDPSKLLVSAKDIASGKVMFANGDTVEAASDINKPVWWKKIEANGDKGGNYAVEPEDIEAGLIESDGTPLKGRLGIVGDIGKEATKSVWSFGAKIVGGAFKFGKAAAKTLIIGKNSYIDVYVKDSSGKKGLVRRLEGVKIKGGEYYKLKNDEIIPLKSAYDIDSEIYTTVDGKPQCLISEDDIANGVYDVDGNKLRRFGDKSLIGLAGTALYHGAKRVLKGIGKGLKGIGNFVGDLFGRGKDVFFSMIDWFKDLRFSGSGLFLNRKDLEEVVGDRLLDIYHLLFVRLPNKKSVIGDIDGDGYRENSYEDYIKRKEKRKKETEVKREKQRQEKKKRERVEKEKKEKQENEDDDSGVFSSILSSGGDLLSDFLMFKWLSGGKGATKIPGKAGKIASLFGKLGGSIKNSKLGTAVTNKSLNNRIIGEILTNPNGKMAGVKTLAKSGLGTVKSGIGAGLGAAKRGLGAAAGRMFGRTAARVAAGTAARSAVAAITGGLAAGAAANAWNPVGWAMALATLGCLAYEAYNLLKTDPVELRWQRLRFPMYGLDERGVVYDFKYEDYIKDFEKDVFKATCQGRTVDLEDLEHFGINIGFISQGLGGLRVGIGKDNNDMKTKRLEYLKLWYGKRFFPAFDAYCSLIKTFDPDTVDPTDFPDVTLIPYEMQDDLLDQYKQVLAKIKSDPEFYDESIDITDEKKFEAWLEKTEKEKAKMSVGERALDEALSNGVEDDSFDYSDTADNFSQAWYNIKNGNLIDAATEGAMGVTSLVTETISGVFRWAGSFFSDSTHETSWGKAKNILYGLDENVDFDDLQDFEEIAAAIIHRERVEFTRKELFDEIDDLLDETDFDTDDFVDVAMNVLKISKSQARSKVDDYFYSWYKRRFQIILRVFLAVAAGFAGKPVSEFDVDDIPEQYRAGVLKKFSEDAEKKLKEFGSDKYVLTLKGYGEFLRSGESAEKSNLNRNKSIASKKSTDKDTGSDTVGSKIDSGNKELDSALQSAQKDMIDKRSTMYSINYSNPFLLSDTKARLSGSGFVYNNNLSQQENWRYLLCSAYGDKTIIPRQGYDVEYRRKCYRRLEKKQFDNLYHNEKFTSKQIREELEYIAEANGLITSDDTKFIKGEKLDYMFEWYQKRFLPIFYLFCIVVEQLGSSDIVKLTEIETSFSDDWPLENYIINFAEGELLAKMETFVKELNKLKRSYPSWLTPFSGGYEQWIKEKYKKTTEKESSKDKVTETKKERPSMSDEDIRKEAGYTTDDSSVNRNVADDSNLIYKPNQKKLADGGLLKKIGGVTEGPTELASDIVVGEAGQETVLPHKGGERFNSLVTNAVNNVYGPRLSDSVASVLTGDNQRRSFEKLDITDDELDEHLSSTTDLLLFNIYKRIALMTDMMFGGNGTSLSGKLVGFGSRSLSETISDGWNVVKESAGNLVSGTFDSIKSAGSTVGSWLGFGDNTSGRSSGSTLPTPRPMTTNNDQMRIAKKIWKQFKSEGWSDQAVAGLLGNIQKESGMECVRVQGDISDTKRSKSAEYTKRADASKFAFTDPKSVGYGLCQWTSADRKIKLWNFCHDRNKSVGDEDSQIEFISYEINKLGSLPASLLKELKNCKSIGRATDIILKRYEAPAKKDDPAELNERCIYALEWWKKMTGQKDDSGIPEVSFADELGKSAKNLYNNVVDSAKNTVKNTVQGAKDLYNDISNSEFGKAVVSSTRELASDISNGNFGNIVDRTVQGAKDLYDNTIGSKLDSFIRKGGDNRAVNTSKLTPDFKNRIAQVAKEYYEKTGKKPLMTSAQRDDKYQAELYIRKHEFNDNSILSVNRPNDDTTITYRGKTFKVPGNHRGVNPHASGNAVDFSRSNDLNLLADIAGKYGIVQPYKAKDPVHFQLAKNPAVFDGTSDESTKDSVKQVEKRVDIIAKGGTGNANGNVGVVNSAASNILKNENSQFTTTTTPSNDVSTEIPTIETDSVATGNIGSDSSSVNSQQLAELQIISGLLREIRDISKTEIPNKPEKEKNEVTLTPKEKAPSNDSSAIVALVPILQSIANKLSVGSSGVTNNTTKRSRSGNIDRNYEFPLNIAKA